MQLDRNLGRLSPLAGALRASVRALVQGREGVPIVPEEERWVGHVLDHPLPIDTYRELKGLARAFGVTPAFRAVIETFHVPEGETPPGFRIEFVLDRDGVIRADLVRDIAFDRNGQRRPTKVLFSADTANPYEVAPIAGLIANLTCNPGIIYDLFINNPEANVGRRFKTRDEVMLELGNVLGPGCDISVELNNPFEESEAKLLEEAERFREMLTPWRVVIKVPHTGPLNARNVSELLSGDKLFHRRFDAGTTSDLLRGHRLALLLREHGFRVNFTLMFEPYQSALALQAKPYFINSFVRHRLLQTAALAQLVERYRASQDEGDLARLRGWMVEKDYLAPEERDLRTDALLAMADRILTYRQYRPGHDGLDGVRHNLRLLRTCNLPDTRLIVCSMEGETMYPDLDALLVDGDFADVADRVVVTAEPAYLAKFTSTNQVVSYQRRFMNAAQGQA